MNNNEKTSLKSQNSVYLTVAIIAMALLICIAISGISYSKRSLRYKIINPDRSEISYSSLA